MDLKKLFSQNKLRQKARKHSKAKKALNKRNKELEKSRNNFRDKYYKLKNKYDNLEKINKEIEDELKKN